MLGWLAGIRGIQSVGPTATMDGGDLNQDMSGTPG